MQGTTRGGMSTFTIIVAYASGCLQVPFITRKIPTYKLLDEERRLIHTQINLSLLSCRLELGFAELQGPAIGIAGDRLPPHLESQFIIRAVV